VLNVQVGDAPCHVAASSKDKDMLTLLLRFAPNLAAANQAGRTALMVACEHASKRMVQMLLDAGSPVNTVAMVRVEGVAWGVGFSNFLPIRDVTWGCVPLHSSVM
jgi:ankyrin repeat protein